MEILGQNYKWTLSKISIYNPPIFLIIIYKLKILIKKIIIMYIRNFLILNKFLNGVKIIKIRPIRLLTKNLGYREIFFQKLSIEKPL